MSLRNHPLGSNETHNSVSFVTNEWLALLFIRCKITETLTGGHSKEGMYFGGQIITSNEHLPLNSAAIIF